MKRLGPLFIVAVLMIGSTVVWKRYKAFDAHPSGQSVASKVDQLFAPWSRPDSPGCSLGISKNGLPVYERAYGMANLELGVPMTPESVLPAASISKQFTAMCILHLAKNGKLALDDDIGKHIPEWPDHGRGNGREAAITPNKDH